MASLDRQLFEDISSSMGKLLVDRGTPLKIDHRFFYVPCNTNDWQAPAYLWFKDKDRRVKGWDAAAGQNVEHGTQRKDVVSYYEYGYHVICVGSDRCDGPGADIAETRGLVSLFHSAFWNTLTGSTHKDTGDVDWLQQRDSPESRLGFKNQRARIDFYVGYHETDELESTVLVTTASMSSSLISTVSSTSASTTTFVTESIATSTDRYGEQHTFTEASGSSKPR